MRMQCATFLLSTPANEAISLDRSASVKRGVKLASSSLPLYEFRGSASFLAASYRNETDQLVIYCRRHSFVFFLRELQRSSVERTGNFSAMLTRPFSLDTALWLMALMLT